MSAMWHLRVRRQGQILPTANMSTAHAVTLTRQVVARVEAQVQELLPVLRDADRRERGKGRHDAGGSRH